MSTFLLGHNKKSITTPVSPSVSPALIYSTAVKWWFSQFHIYLVVHATEPPRETRLRTCIWLIGFQTETRNDKILWLACWERYSNKSHTVVIQIITWIIGIQLTPQLFNMAMMTINIYVNVLAAPMLHRKFHQNRPSEISKIYFQDGHRGQFEYRIGFILKTSAAPHQVSSNLIKRFMRSRK